MSTLLPEDASERRMFNDGASVLTGGDALRAAAGTLEMWHRMSDKRGSYGLMLAILSNECTKAADRRDTLDDLLRELIAAEREACAAIAEAVQGRAAENAQELMMRPRSLSLEQMREIDNRLAGQRHAADEIARAIRARVAV